jgi:hypothetical protein
MIDDLESAAGYSDRFFFAKRLGEQWGTTLADRLLTDPGWPSCDQLKEIARYNVVVMQTGMALNDILRTGELAPYAEMILTVMMRSYRDALPNFAKQGEV